MKDQEQNMAGAFSKRAIALPADLLERWTDGQYFHEFRADGSYYFGGGPRPFTVSTDGQTLQIDSATFARIGGTDSDIQGLWLNSSDNTEWRFRADGTDTLHESGGDSYQGIYETDGTNLTRLEKRAFVIAAGNLLTFQPNWSLWQPAAYTRSGDQLTLMFESGTFVWTVA